MSDSKLYKEFDQCPICGDPLKKNKKGLMCNCCGFVAPTEEISSIDEARLNQASDALRSYRFDQAEEAYSLILEDNRDSDSLIHVAALWGKLLANFGVVYIKDMNGSLIPTFAEYDPDYKSITEAVEYKAIVKSKVSNEVKNSYLEKAKLLDVVYKQIDKELDSKKEYDFFICTKISRKTPRHPEYDGYTEDSRIADDFYFALKDAGLSVFYSDKCCQGIEYDSQIFSAILKSKKIIIISSGKEYLESPWVQSEWRRWLNFIECGKKEKDSIYLYLPHYEKDPFDMPRALKKVQRYTRQLQLMNLLTAGTKKESPKKKQNDEVQSIKEQTELIKQSAKLEKTKAKIEEKALKDKAKEEKKALKAKADAKKKATSKTKRASRKKDFEYYISCHTKGWLYFLGTIPIVVCAVLALINIFKNNNVYTPEALQVTKTYFFIGIGVFIVGLVMLFVGFLNAYYENGDSDGDTVSLVANGIVNTLATIAGIVSMVAVLANGKLNITGYYVDEVGGAIYAQYDTRYEVVDIVDGKTDIIIEGRIGNLIVDEIGEDQFKGNTSITSLTFQNGDMTIKKGAFENCYNIESITFGPYTYNIGQSAFAGITGLDFINVGKATLVSNYDSQSQYAYQKEGNMFGYSTTAVLSIDGGKISYMVDMVDTYIISNGSEVLISSYGKENGANVYIDNTIVVFTEGVNFTDTKMYVRVNDALLGNNFKYYPVGYTIYLPESVTSIPDYFFGDLMHLDKLTIHYAGTEEMWKEISISDTGNSNLSKAKIIYNSTYVD